MPDRKKKRIRLKLVTDGRLVAVRSAHRDITSKMFCITLVRTDNGVIQNPFVFISKILEHTICI